MLNIHQDQDDPFQSSLAISEETANENNISYQSYTSVQQSKSPSHSSEMKV